MLSLVFVSHGSSPGAGALLRCDVRGQGGKRSGGERDGSDRSQEGDFWHVLAVSTADHINECLAPNAGCRFLTSNLPLPGDEVVSDRMRRASSHQSGQW